MPRNTKQVLYEALTTIPIDQSIVSGLGTVTSVSMTTPSILNVSGSPITTSGSLGLTLTTQTANRVFAGPTSGGAATPTFRALVAADIPSLSGTYQPLDADLTAIAALNSTGFARQAGAGSWSIVAETGSDAVVRATSPTLTTPILGTPTSGTLTNCTVATATANDNDTSIASTAFVQGQGQNYKVYDATLTQTGTSAPTATVGQNNIGQTMTWARSSAGVYTVTAGAAAFTANKTQVLLGCFAFVAGKMRDIYCTVTSTTVITISTAETSTDASGYNAIDDLLTSTAIRIVIFP